MKLDIFVLIIVLIDQIQSQNEMNSIDNVDMEMEQKGQYNMKIGYKLNHIDSPLVDIIWCGVETLDNQVLVLTEKGSIYKSNDKGLTWHKKTEILQQLAFMEIDEGESTGVVQKIMLSPVDKNLVLLIGTHGINWKSIDCGENMIAMNQGRQVSEFQFHPIIRESLLAVAWSKCEDYEDEPCTLQKELYHSSDLGEEWKLIEDYVVQFTWAYQDQSYKDITPLNRIILAHQPKGKGHQNITKWTKDVHISYSDDYFQTRTTMLKHGNKFLLSKGFLYAVQVKNENRQDINLMVANPKIRTNYEFVNTEFPFDSLKDKSYTILESDGQSVFLNVNHQGDNAKYGNLYMSDETGQKFSLAISNNVRDQEGTCDFEKVLSLDGIYLVNYYESPILNKYRKNRNKIEIESYKKTKITFNNGGQWRLVDPPEVDSKGNQIDCDMSLDCSLHFHTVTSSDIYGSFYSTDKAIGVVIATGNVGKYLSGRKGEVNTYLSRDGGRSWKEVMKGSYIYEIGDHGGLIIMASDEQSTNTIRYSFNEGLSWYTFTFSSQMIRVSNIINEPSNTALSFIVYGKDMNDQGVMILLDYSQFVSKECRGLDIPDHDTSDYELWNIEGVTKSQCSLGQKQTVVRKKLDSQCYNGQKFEKKIFREVCKCTESDYECDVGYSREFNQPCKLTNSSHTSMTDVMMGFYDDHQSRVIQNCSDYYYVSSGYRKIAGDVCKGGVSYEPVKIECPKAIRDMENIKQGLLLNRLIIGAVIVGLILIILYLKWETLYNNIQIGIQNVKFMINRNKFNYDAFNNDEDVDFSKMVFDEENNEDSAQLVEDNKLI